MMNLFAGALAVLSVANVVSAAGNCCPDTIAKIRECKTLLTLKDIFSGKPVQKPMRYKVNCDGDVSIFRVKFINSVTLKMEYRITSETPEKGHNKFSMRFAPKTQMFESKSIWVRAVSDGVVNEDARVREEFCAIDSEDVIMSTICVYETRDCQMDNQEPGGQMNDRRPGGQMTIQRPHVEINNQQPKPECYNVSYIQFDKETIQGVSSTGDHVESYNWLGAGSTTLEYRCSLNDTSPAMFVVSLPSKVLEAPIEDIEAAICEFEELCPDVKVMYLKRP